MERLLIDHHGPCPQRASLYPVYNLMPDCKPYGNMGKLGSLPIVRGTSKTNYYVKLWKVYWRSLTVEECLHMAWLGYSHLFWKNRADNLFRSLKFLFICFICVLHKNLSWFSNIIMTSLANCLACFFPEVGIDCSILSAFSSLVSLTTDIIRHLIWNSREI